MYRKSTNKIRCQEVDDQIELLFKEKLPTFKIARQIPIGEPQVIQCLRERKLLPREVKRKKFADRKAKDRAYYENVRKPQRLAKKLKELEASA